MGRNSGAHSKGVGVKAPDTEHCARNGGIGLGALDRAALQWLSRECEGAQRLSDEFTI